MDADVVFCKTVPASAAAAAATSIGLIKDPFLRPPKGISFGMDGHFRRLRPLYAALQEGLSRPSRSRQGARPPQGTALLTLSNACSFL